MQGSSGEWLARQLRLLRNWRKLAEAAAQAAKSLDPTCEVYVFGSTVEGRYTAASDIDLLLLTRQEPKEFARRLLQKLWKELGDDTAILDIHAAKHEDKNKPPYSWWLQKAVKIT